MATSVKGNICLIFYERAKKTLSYFNTIEDEYFKETASAQARK